MKASPRILSSPGAPWRSTGRPVTAMRARHWPIPRFLSFLIDSMGCARSISAKSGPSVRRHGECDASFPIARIDATGNSRQERVHGVFHYNFCPTAMGGLQMRYFALVLAVVGAATGACAQDAIPDLKGTWFGKGRVITFGGLPDSQPTVRDIEMTLLVEGQDGRLAWGRSSSANADTKEPFAWAISSDNKSIIGSGTDGSFRITLLAPDRMEKCYTHNSLGPSGSIMAGCYPMERAKK